MSAIKKGARALRFANTDTSLRCKNGLRMLLIRTMFSARAGLRILVWSKETLRTVTGDWELADSSSGIAMYRHCESRRMRELLTRHAEAYNRLAAHAAGVLAASFTAAYAVLILTGAAPAHNRGVGDGLQARRWMCPLVDLLLLNVA